MRASIHLERAQPPEAVWYAWLPPIASPPDIPITAYTIWNAYTHRWPVEPGMHFRKETLGWTLPRFPRAETGDTWTQLVMLAHGILFLARPIVEDVPLPWQKPQRHLTPQRVRQSLKPIFARIGPPSRHPKPRGKPPGWRTGRRRTPKMRHSVVRKGAGNARAFQSSNLWAFLTVAVTLSNIKLYRRPMVGTLPGKTWRYKKRCNIKSLKTPAGTHKSLDFRLVRCNS